MNETVKINPEIESIIFGGQPPKESRLDKIRRRNKVLLEMKAEKKLDRIAESIQRHSSK